MDEKLIVPDEIKSKTAQALPNPSQEESEQLLLEMIQEAKDDVERFLSYLYYGEMLMKWGRWEDSRQALMRSAQIALHRKEHSWLVLSHEKLGDVSTAEENSFGALHHYRYALRNVPSFLDGPVTRQLEAKAKAAASTLCDMVLSQDTSIIPLSKEYVSGNLAVYFVQRDIFLKTYFARCLECNFCYDWCCSFGADIDIQNVEKIEQRKAEILPFVRPPEGEWFNGEYTYYEEYTGNEYTRINTQGPRCVFISKDQRGCGLHRYAISKQIDYHEIKPLVCILFPLSFEEGVLLVAPELDDNSLVCAGLGVSVYQSLRNELEYYFGHEFLEELDQIERNVLSEKEDPGRLVSSKSQIKSHSQNA